MGKTRSWTLNLNGSSDFRGSEDGANSGSPRYAAPNSGEDVSGGSQARVLAKNRSGGSLPAGPPEPSFLSSGGFGVYWAKYVMPKITAIRRKSGTTIFSVEFMP